jgi:NADH:quinone reductase (non-electrogenic)
VSKLPNSPERHRVVIVGAGFAGYNAAQELSRIAGAATEITVINSTDYFLYLSLLPQVAAGLVEPRHICISLLRRMPRVRFVPGTVTHVDVRQKVVTWSGPEYGSGQAGFDRLILTAGSVNKLLPIPGVADFAHGSAASPRPFTCATTSSVSSSLLPEPLTRWNAERAAPS